MLRKINALMPRFFREFDRRLLLNQPEIWATKIHYVIFLGGVGLGLFSLYSFIKPIDLTNVPNPENVFSVSLICAAIGFLFWAWQTTKFDLEKTNGVRSPGHGIKNQFLLAMGVGLLAILPFLTLNSFSNKISSSVSQEVLIQDINAFNLGAKYFSGSDYNGNKTPESFRVWIYWNDVYSENQVDNILHNTHTREESISQIKSFIHSLEKYGGILPQGAENPEIIFKRFKKGQAFTLGYKTYNKFSDNTWRIYNAHDEVGELYTKDFRLFYGFFVFMAFLTMLIFQKNNRQSFSLSILFGLGLIIGSALVSALLVDFMGMGKTSVGVLFFSVFSFLIVQAYMGKNTQRLNVWKKVSLNVVTVFTPIIPLVILLMTQDSFRNNVEFDALYLGVALTIFLWNAAYRPQFVKLQSIPKEN